MKMIRSNPCPPPPQLVQIEQKLRADRIEVRLVPKISHAQQRLTSRMPSIRHLGHLFRCQRDTFADDLFRGLAVDRRNHEFEQQRQKGQVDIWLLDLSCPPIRDVAAQVDELDADETPADTEGGLGFEGAQTVEENVNDVVVGEET